MSRAQSYARTFLLLSLTVCTTYILTTPHHSSRVGSGLRGYDPRHTAWPVVDRPIATTNADPPHSELIVSELGIGKQAKASALRKPADPHAHQIPNEATQIPQAPRRALKDSGTTVPKKHPNEISRITSYFTNILCRPTRHRMISHRVYVFAAIGTTVLLCFCIGFMVPQQFGQGQGAGRSALPQLCCAYSCMENTDESV